MSGKKRNIENYTHTHTSLDNSDLVRLLTDCSFAHTASAYREFDYICQIGTGKRPQNKE